MSACTCNWNALGPAPRCPVHSPPPVHVCTCDRCPCCGGVKAAPYFDWTYRPQPWVPWYQTGPTYTWTITSTSTTGS